MNDESKSPRLLDSLPLVILIEPPEVGLDRIGERRQPSRPMISHAA
jgi:hypothetical protein